MKNYIKVLLILLSFILMLGCTQDQEKEASIDFNYNLSSVVSRVVKNNAPTRAVDAVTGIMTVVDTTDGTEQVFNWYGTLDEENFTASSNSTIILSSGEYNFSLVFTSGGYQYAGEVFNHVIIEGENTVNFNLQPIIGETVTNINLTQLSSLKFQYDNVELGNLRNPVIGMIVDGGLEIQFTINPSIGLSENYINLSMGEHKIELKLYDNGMQIGKSVLAQEDVILGLTNVNMDLVPLHGETMFNLSLDGGDAVFNFVIPKEVVEEVGVLANLKTIFKIVGNINTLREEEVTLTLNGEGDYEGQVTLSDYRYDVVTMTLEFYDISMSPEDLIGSSVIEDANLIKDSVNLTYAVDLRRRAVVTGSLLGILGVNVYDTGNMPVVGAKVYANDELIGITGSGIFGNSGYLKSYLPAGDYIVEAVGETYRGEVETSLAVLGIENENIILDTELIPPAEPVVNGIEEGQTYSGAVTPTIVEEDGVTYIATLNGEDYVLGTEITEDGEYELVVTAVGEYGLSSIKAYNFIINSSQIFRVNSSSEGAQLEPSVASFSDGSFVIVWRGYNDEKDYFVILGQKFNSNKEKVGEEFIINTIDGVYPDPNVLSFSDDSFLVTWYHTKTGGSYKVKGQIFNKNGIKKGEEFEIGRSSSSSLRGNNYIVKLSETRALITWLKYSTEGWITTGKIVNNEGSFIGEEFEINHIGKLGGLAAINSEKWLTVGDATIEGGDGHDIYAQIYNGNNEKEGELIKLNTETYSNQRHASIASFLDGSFVVSWASRTEGIEFSKISCQVFNSNGIKIGEEFKVNSTNMRGDRKSRVETLSNGKFVVIWESASDLYWAYQNELYGQIFNRDGSKYGEEFRVNESETYFVDNFKVESLLYGKFIVTWQDMKTETYDDNTILARVFESE